MAPTAATAAKLATTRSAPEDPSGGMPGVGVVGTVLFPGIMITGPPGCPEGVGGVMIVVKPPGSVVGTTGVVLAPAGGVVGTAGVGISVSLTGQTVVETGMTVVVIDPTGQFVTDAGHLVTVPVEVE